MHARNKAVQDLAQLIGRSANAVALKLVNFARLDPELQKRNISGMSHGSKMDIEIWNEFVNNWEDRSYQSEILLAKIKNDSVEHTNGILSSDLPKEGKEREAIVKIRVNQYFFRQTILASYNNTCCVTGISIPDLLVSSHIIPWAIDTKNRMNPCNGLCLNALHDVAFDKGLITITPDFRLKVSNVLRKRQSLNELLFIQYDNKSISLPQKFTPSREFIEYHNKYIFKET
jgi:putative restriction endonuclease